MINAIPPLVSDRGSLPHVVGGDFRDGGGGRVLPIPAWMTFKTTRLPSEAEVEPWYDAVCALWDDPALYRAMAARAHAIARGAVQRRGVAQEACGLLHVVETARPPHCGAGRHALVRAGLEHGRCHHGVVQGRLGLREAGREYGRAVRAAKASALARSSHKRIRVGTPGVSSSPIRPCRSAPGRSRRIPTANSAGDSRSFRGWRRPPGAPDRALACTVAT